MMAESFEAFLDQQSSPSQSLVVLVLERVRIFSLSPPSLISAFKMVPSLVQFIGVLVILLLCVNDSHQQQLGTVLCDY